METVPDAIRRHLLPSERLIWFGKPSARRVMAYGFLPIVWGIAIVVFSKSLLLALVGSMVMELPLSLWLLIYYAITDIRVIMVLRIHPSRAVYVNLINDLDGPIAIKLGRIDRIRFRTASFRRGDTYSWIMGGPVSDLGFVALEDRKTVYDLAVSAQRAAETTLGTH